MVLKINNLDFFEFSYTLSNKYHSLNKMAVLGRFPAYKILVLLNGDLYA